MNNPLKQIDTKELKLPETVFIRDVETRVFHSIVFRVLNQIDGIETLEGNLLDDLLGDGIDGIKGIHIEQDQKNHSINVKVEVNIAYGLQIPRKAEEIQMRIVQEISDLTSLHVGSVHVVFKNLISNKIESSLEEAIKKSRRPSVYDEVL
jgi:uncharacterized alkaline shock family protein YloU